MLAAVSSFSRRTSSLSQRCSVLTSDDSHGPENRHRDSPARQRRGVCKGGPGPVDRVLRRVYYARLIRGQRDFREGGKEDHRMRPHHEGPGTARILRVCVSSHRGRLGAQGTAEGTHDWPQTPTSIAEGLHKLLTGLKNRGGRRSSTSSTRAGCLWRSSRKSRPSSSPRRLHGTIKWRLGQFGRIVPLLSFFLFLHLDGVEDPVWQDWEGIRAVQFMSSRPHCTGVHAFSRSSNETKCSGHSRACLSLYLLKVNPWEFRSQDIQRPA